MTKTDVGFCCAFNTISVQSSYASESGEEYDPSEYQDDDYDYYDEDRNDENCDDSEATTSTESPDAVTYPGSRKNCFCFFKVLFLNKHGSGGTTTTEESTGSSSSEEERW